MENKAHALAAGIFVALLTALVLGLAAWLTRDTGIRDSYEIATRETVTGLQAQAPVRYLGVDVGKVASVGFDPAAPGSVLLRLEVDRQAPITASTYATLSYQGVTGLAFIQLADDGTSKVRLQPDDDKPPRIPLRPGMLAKLEARGEVILEQVEQVTVRINKLLGDENQTRVAKALENVAQTADSTSKLVQTLDRTVTQRIDPALATAVVTFRSVQGAADEVDRAATGIGETARRLTVKDGPLDRLSEGTDALAQAADAFGRSSLPRINRVADEATRTVRSLRRAVDELTENPQALLYGDGPLRPGPGEPGFQPPEVRR